MQGSISGNIINVFFWENIRNFQSGLFKDISFREKFRSLRPKSALGSPIIHYLFKIIDDILLFLWVETPCPAFGYVEKWLDLKDKVNFKIFDVTDRKIYIYILPSISRSKGNQTMKFGQLMQNKMQNNFFRKSYKNVLVPDFMKNWAYLRINSLKYYKDWFYCMSKWKSTKI